MMKPFDSGFFINPASLECMKTPIIRGLEFGFEPSFKPVFSREDAKGRKIFSLTDIHSTTVVS
jgi:hypothetical protein